MPVNECQFSREREEPASLLVKNYSCSVDPTCVLFDDDFVASFLHAERVKRKSRISVNSFNEIVT